MKKLLLCGSLFAMSLFCAQDKFSEFSLSYFDTKPIYNIEISQKKGEIESIYIDGFSMSTISSKGSMILYQKKVEDFISFLNFSRDKYIEWTKTAKENNVQDLAKDIKPEKKLLLDFAFLYGSKWQFQNGKYVNARYKIVNGKYLLIIESGPLQSSSNQFMKSDGLVWIFSDVSEIDNLIKELDIVKMTDFVKQKGNKEDLFK